MTTRPTVPTFSRWCHRVHRSIGGRRRRKIGEDKTPIFFIKEKKSKKMLDVEKIIEDPTFDILDIAEGKLPAIPDKPKCKKPFYVENSRNDRPILLCESCGYQIRLTYAPNFNPEKLDDTICPSCHERAYWRGWWRERMLGDPRVFLACAWMRDQIYEKKMTLKYILKFNP